MIWKMLMLIFHVIIALKTKSSNCRREIKDPLARQLLLALFISNFALPGG